MAVAFVGPSYNLSSYPASVQRTINMVPLPIEPGNEKASWRFQDLPGLVQWASLGAEIRGAVTVGDRAFVVSGSTLYEVSSGGTGTSLGTLSTSTGRVGMAYNTTQLVVGDTQNLYVLTLSSNAFASYTYEGNGSLAFLDQYILFAHRSGQAFGWTAVGDASSIDPLDFSSAEGSPDNIVGLIVDHREVFLPGTLSGEVWSSVGGEEVFARNSGAFIETGCAAWPTIQKLGGSIYWLGQSDRGQGRVYRLEGYREIPVSTHPIEQRLSGIDLSEATAYAYEDGGSSFYCLNVPALDTTLAFDAKTGQWAERAEWVNGSYTKHRARVFLRAFNRNFVGDGSGYIYELDHEAHDNAGDVLVRDRITPHDYAPARERLGYGTFTLACDQGHAGQVMLRYSDDGGSEWCGWKVKTAGAIGRRKDRLHWTRNGSGRDRVWHVRCTDAVPFNPTWGGTV